MLFQTQVKEIFGFTTRRSRMDEISIEKAKELLPIIEAYANGKPLEYTWRRQPWRDVGDGFVLNLSLLERGMRLRVKPEE